MVKSLLLLAVVVMYIIRDMYLLFGAAISPILALFWAFPKTRQYAQPFISTWWAALAIAPLNVLVLKFAFAMMDLSASAPIQSLNNWMLGIASLSLMLLLPWQLYGAAQTIIGPALLFSATATDKAGEAARHRLDRYRGRNSERRSQMYPYRERQQHQPIHRPRYRRQPERVPRREEGVQRNRFQDEIDSMLDDDMYSQNRGEN